MRDIRANIRHDQILDPAVLSGVAGKTNSASVDMQRFRQLSLYGLVGESGDTLSSSLRLYLQVEHSDDDLTWAACANADLSRTVAGEATGTFADVNAAAVDDAVYQTQYIGNKRYVRVVANRKGTHTTGIPVALLALRFGETYTPVVQPT